MPSLPENNTPRLFIDYTDGINPHTLLVRYSASYGLAATMGDVDAFLSALQGSLYQLTVTGARASASGSNISTPVTWTGSSTYGSGTMTGVFAPRQICFLGRDSTGRKVRWFLFGFKGNTPDTYRINVGDNGDVDAAITALSNAGAAGSFLTIALHSPALYGYADINFNNYYEAKTRA